MKKIGFFLTIIFTVIGFAQNPIPSFTYSEVVSWPPEGVSYFTIDENNDGWPDNMEYDSETGDLTYYNIVSIGGNTAGDPVILPLEGLLIECFVPPFVSNYHISIDEPVLASGAVAIRMIVLEVAIANSPTPEAYDESTFPDESYWRWHTSANRNWQLVKDPDYFDMENVTRIPAYNGMNFGYSTPPENYWGPIVLDQINLGWRINNIDSADFMNWLNSTASTSENHTLDERSINVSPNPVSDIMFIEGLNQSAKIIEIFDFSGKLVKHLAITDNKKPIQVSELKSGMYLIRSGNQYQKFIKK